LYWSKNGENTYPRLKKFLSEMEGGMVPVDLWKHEETGTTDQGSKELEELLGENILTFQSHIKRKRNGRFTFQNE
jgi:adenine-specific DNA-methyltransferase